MYTVRAVIDGVEGADSAAASVWAQKYLRIPLMVPRAARAPSACPTSNEAYSYGANDASTGDVDGDGVYEIILKWDPSNAKDNSQAGVTGNVFIDAYKLDGTRLWRIDLGPNIRAGAHYTQFIVHDFDGDGTRRARGEDRARHARRHGRVPVEAGPAASDTDTMAYRNGDGYVLTGPEYLTRVQRQDRRRARDRQLRSARGTVSSWGDSYGNRVDRFLATARLPRQRPGCPSFVMARGYYTRTTLTAWNWRDGQLTQLWKFDSNTTPRDSMNRSYTGQGAHSLSRRQRRRATTARRSSTAR